MCDLFSPGVDTEFCLSEETILFTHRDHCNQFCLLADNKGDPKLKTYAGAPNGKF